MKITPTKNLELWESVLKDLNEQGARYDRDLMREFQQTAKIRVIDGLYGPETAQALAQFLRGAAPPALFASDR
jgi:hypothetical protein